MESTLSPSWYEKLKILDIAFQSILNIYTGRIYAVEALLRNYQDVGCKSIFDLFDAAYHDGMLYPFDLALREKTLKKYKKISNYEKIKLFYNLDNRLFHLPNYSKGNTDKLLKKTEHKKRKSLF